MSIELHDIGKFEAFLKDSIVDDKKITLFNTNLKQFTNAWKNAAGSTYTKSAAKFGSVFNVDYMKKADMDLVLQSGGKGTIATIELKTLYGSNYLGNFAMSNNMEDVEEAGGSGTFRVARSALLRNSQRKVVVVSSRNRSRILQLAKTGKTPVFQGRIKGFMPKGHKHIMIRLQPNTWYLNKRLPTVRLFAPPDSYLINSRRVRDKLNYEKRITSLWKQ